MFEVTMGGGHGRIRWEILPAIVDGAASSQVIDASRMPEADVDARVRDAARQRPEALFVRNVDADRAAALAAAWPTVTYHPHRRLLVVGGRSVGNEGTDVNVVTAGTADLPVADEVEIAARALGLRVRREADVGVAGLHRLLAVHPALNEARCTIALAGMEGALAPTVARLVAHPVIGVPTSVGYGASMGGLATLLAMQFSGAPLRTVGVDQGIEAALLARHLLLES